MTTPPSHQIYTNSPQQVEANKAAQTSMIMGIIGIFFFGIILGPLAIWQAKKAESLGAAATVGKVTGWIALILSVIGIISIIAMIATMGALASSSGY